VPFIVRWPATVKPGSECHQLIEQTDVFRTLAELLGTKLPDNAGEDSFSMLPLLRGEQKPIRENAVSASSGGLPAVRLGDWKYIPGAGGGGFGAKGDPSRSVQLYNLADDLGETKNLAAAMPEKVAEMKAMLETVITAGRSTPGAPQKNDVEVKRYPVKAAN
jgi:arylsulfatase A-like enzyme